MTAVLTAVVAFGLITALFFWQRLLRSWRTKPSTALWLASLLLALAVALQLPSVHDVLAYKIGWNLFWPTQWALTVACCLMVHIFAIRVAPSTPQHARLATRRITATMGAAFVLAVVLFSTAPNDPAFILGPTSRLEVPGRVTATVGLAWVVVMIIIGGSCLSHALRTYRWATRANHATQVWLRVGMTLTAAGFAAGLLYSVHSAAYQTAQMLGWIPSWTQRSVSDPLITMAPALIFVGTVLPAIGSWRRERRLGRRLLSRLEPVRRLLASTAPPKRLTLASRLRRWLQRQWRPSVVVYQSMIDLEDAYLRIQHEIPENLPRRVTEQADEKGLDGDTRRALALAVTVATWAASPRPRDIEPILRVLIARTGRGGPDPSDNAVEDLPKNALIADLDRWLRAADLLRDAPLDQPAPARPAPVPRGASA